MFNRHGLYAALVKAEYYGVYKIFRDHHTTSE